MELLNQKMKKEMEECKRVARAAGLQFPDNTLEYIVRNRDMLELSAKHMIPTLYDFWVHDVGALRNRWIYDVFPQNPYETVINTRPPISFYNQDNADWFNVWVFYHVLGHIDFFQNNIFFRRTWDDDFAGQALADKRLINRIREELGGEKRWVDYVIEFSRAIDNLVGYYPELQEAGREDVPDIFGTISTRADFYFGRFLRGLYESRAIGISFYYEEIDRFNECLERFGKEKCEKAFFEDDRIRGRFPELQGAFHKWKEEGQKSRPKDIFEYLWEHSEFLNKEENTWMKDVMQVVRRTSLYFQPQIRTKFANEGWASLWHERLYVPDPRIRTHEVDYARVDSGVTYVPRMGFNPYAGKYLFAFIEELARKGKLSRDYQLLKNIEARRGYDGQRGDAYARKVLFDVRTHVTDELLINFLSDEDFQDFVDKHNLFIVGVRPHREKWDKAEVYIKSKNGKRYRELLKKSLYHPPYIVIRDEKAKDGELYLDHVYEGRSLVAKYIPQVLAGLEFFWGKRVRLETTEYEMIQPSNWWEWSERGFDPKYRKVRALYTCQNKHVERHVL